MSRIESVLNENVSITDLEISEKKKKEKKGRKGKCGIRPKGDDPKARLHCVCARAERGRRLSRHGRNKGQ